MSNGVKQKRKKRKKSKLKRYFLTGILITAPIGLTLYLTWLFIAWMDALVSPVLPDWLNPERSSSYAFPGVGLIVTILFLVIIGWLMAGFLGRWFMGITEGVLYHVPVVKTIYAVIKQVLETALTDQSKAFKEPVLVEFPRKDCWILAFATSRDRVSIDEATGGKMVSVIIPTTPNLTSGYLVFVDEKDVRKLNMSTEEALKLIISGGLVSTDQPVVEQKK